MRIFFYTVQINLIVSLIKNISYICMDQLIIFKDCKNHLWYIATKTFCNGLELIHRRYSYRSWKYWKNVCIKDKERRRWQIMMRLVHSSNETKWTNHRAALKRKKTLNFFIIFNLIIESLHNNNFLLYTIQVYSRSNRLAFLKNEVFL